MAGLTRGALAPASLLALVGCTGTVDASNSPDADSSELAAAISIDTTSYADEATPAHTTAVARFIRARVGVDDATLHMLGAAIDLPPVGTCSGISARAESANHAAAALDRFPSLELVDVGAIQLDLAGHSAFMAPRNLPDMDDLVWGVVYSARTDDTNRAVSGPIALRVAGSKDVGAFSIDVGDLQAPANVMFNDDARAPIILGTNEDLRVSWAAAAPSNDLIYFEIVSGDETLVCTETDRGSASLPASLFGSAPSGTITIHRLHREAVVAHGVDDGQARFDFAREYDFVAP